MSRASQLPRGWRSAPAAVPGARSRARRAGPGPSGGATSSLRGVGDRGGLGTHARRDLPGQTESTRPCQHAHPHLVQSKPQSAKNRPNKARDLLPAHAGTKLLPDSASQPGARPPRARGWLPTRAPGVPPCSRDPPAQTRLPRAKVRACARRALRSRWRVQTPRTWGWPPCSPAPAAAAVQLALGCEPVPPG